MNIVETIKYHSDRILKSMSKKDSLINLTPRVFKVGGTWGNKIQWFPSDQWDDGIAKDEYTVAGWKNKKPEPKDLLVGEFEKSFITFEFVSVDLQYDPPDMFFAKVKPIKQEFKATKEAS